MGAIGSKNELGPIVVIYGCNYNDFFWKKNQSTSVYHTGGIIINLSGKLYVVTTRSKLIGCNNIIMYHSYFTEKHPVLRQELHILFQSVEYNLIILGTINKNELDLSFSKLVSGMLDGAELSIGSQSSSYEFNGTFIVPSKKSKYYTVRMNIDPNSDITNYDVHIYDVKYTKSFINNKTYLPDNYMYKFDLITTEQKLWGICGAVIFNDKHQFVGIIVQSKSNKLYVLPTKTVLKVVHDFSSFFPSNIGKYCGPLTLSLPLNLSKKFSPKITQDIMLDTSDGKIVLKKDDCLLQINGNEVLVREDEIVLYDNDFKNHIPIQIYLRLNMGMGIPIKIKIKRNKKISEFMVLGEPLRNYIFPISGQDIFFPKCLIPFVLINDCVIVELTHELLDVAFFKKTKLSNDVIDKFINDGKINGYQHLLLIDCLNKNLRKKYNLPKLSLGQDKNISCPLVTMINNKKVSTINEVNKVIAQSESLRPSLLQEEHQVQNIIRLGLSYNSQNEISL